MSEPLMHRGHVVTPFTALVHREHGSCNWVLARRKTEALMRQYGEDVVALSRKEYDRLELKLELERAAEQPSMEWLTTFFGSKGDAADFIRGLRHAGFRIEEVPVRLRKKPKSKTVKRA